MILSQSEYHTFLSIHLNLIYYAGLMSKVIDSNMTFDQFRGLKIEDKIECNRTVSSPGTASLGWRADALVPCFLLVTETISLWHETSLPSIWTWYLLTVSLWPLATLPPTGTGKKQVTATQTAPNQTAGPLAGMSHISRPENGWHFFNQPKEEWAWK